MYCSRRGIHLATEWVGHGRHRLSDRGEPTLHRLRLPSYRSQGALHRLLLAAQLFPETSQRLDLPGRCFSARSRPNSVPADRRETRPTGRARHHGGFSVGLVDGRIRNRPSDRDLGTQFTEKHQDVVQETPSSPCLQVGKLAAIHTDGFGDLRLRSVAIAADLGQPESEIRRRSENDTSFCDHRATI